MATATEISLRDEIAMRAMQAIIAKIETTKTTINDPVFNWAARGAYRYADAMLAARERVAA